jgi:hypothetical protein
MSTNETDVVEIKTSALRTLGLVFLSMLLTAFSVAIALDVLPGDERIGLVHRALGIVGALFFGLGTAAWLWRHLNRRGVVLTISREGIRDTRIAPETIPWSAVRRIFTWEYSGQRILVLDVDPAVERTLHLSAIARWTRKANRKLGADGLCIATHGLKINYDELFELVRRRVLQARS